MTTPTSSTPGMKMKCAAVMSPMATPVRNRRPALLHPAADLGELVLDAPMRRQIEKR